MSYRAPHATVRRAPKRAAYDEAAVHAVLDAGFVGQVAFVDGGRPVQVPMLYGRDGAALLLHASPKSRFYRVLATGVACSLGVTFCDGLVLARSAMHHAVNYRSAVVFGRCREVTDPAEKQRAFAHFTDAVVPGRFAECRPMLAREAAVTGVLALTVEAASAKVRTGGPHDDPADRDLAMWAGVVPMRTTYGEPVDADDLPGAYPPPASVARLVAGG